MLFYFYCWVITFSNKHQTWEHYCHPHALCVVNVECIMTGSPLPWITMFSRCLNFGGALHLCFAVSERASEIPLHIISWLFWQIVGIWDILLLLASWLCHWYEWIEFLRVITSVVSYDHCWKPGCYLSIYIETRTKEFVKVFLSHFQFVNWIAWGQAKV